MKINHISPLRSLVFASLLGLAGIANASSTSANMPVTSTINPVCTLNAQNMIVGIFVPRLSGFLATSSNISVTCTRLTSYTIRLTQGADLISRVLSGTTKGQQLLYDVFQDAGFNNIMKNQDGEIVGVGTGHSQVYTLHGRLNRNQFVAEDIYVNNLVIDINY